MGSVEGCELGDGLGITDGLLLGTSVGAPVSGHSTQISVNSAASADEYTYRIPHKLVPNGGDNTHSSVFSSYVRTTPSISIIQVSLNLPNVSQ